MRPWRCVAGTGWTGPARRFSVALASSASLTSVACVASWVAVGLALCLPTTAQADTQVRTSSFEYDALGLLVREVIEPDRPNDCLQTSYRYDAWGNKASVATSACPGASGHTLASAASPRTAATDWGADGRFPVTSTNALGHSEGQSFDPRTGLPTRLVGPNGVVTTWAYDGLGRRLREQRADRTATTWVYRLCTEPGADCPAPIGRAAAWVVVEQSLGADDKPNAPDKLQFHDKLGRILRVQTTGFDGAGPALVLVQDTEYDRLGRVARKSVLYALNDGDPAWTTFAYDALGRVATQTSPAGDISLAPGLPNLPTGSREVTTGTTYSSLSTTVTNALGQRKTTTRNAQGLVAQVTDDQGGIIRYRYDALGQLIETDAAGLVTRLRYDQRGRKVVMQDPAMGEWQYGYNAFGELVWQRDALGQVTTQAYDTLGRLVQRSEPDLISRWSYDRRFDGSACGKSIGKLCEATADNGYRRVHHYDSRGRPQSTSTVLDNPAQPAVMSVTYDESTGRIARQRWPTGFEARYAYTEGGFLRRVTGTPPPVQALTPPGAGTPPAAPVTYEVLAVDAQGHVTQFRQGSALTVRKFDRATGRLHRQQVAGGAILAQAWSYDKLGNLLARADTSPGVGTLESFAYDRLNRLALYTVIGGALTAPQATEVLYDSRGNIRYKSDVGSYWYDPARPTRLTNVTLDAPPGASLPITGTRALSYAFDDTLAQPPGAPPPPPGMPPSRGNDVTLAHVTLGNGNLVYTVSQDRARQRQTLRLESYTSFNKPREFSYSDFAQGSSPPATADRTLSFVYGPEHQRIRQQVRIAGNAPSALSSGSTWYLHGEGEQALSYEKEVKDSGLVEHRHYLQAGGMVFAMFVTRTGSTGAMAGQKPTATRYFHQDHLGSIAAIADEGGQLIERLAYDPWGKRRHVDGYSDPTDSLIGWSTERGYTMHEHLDEIGVIHMNGRVYDPLISRFLSADPFIQSPQDLQSHNRYAYVLNNPLAYTDPSGYFSFKKLFRTAVSIAVAVYFGPAVIGNFAGAGQLFAAASFGGSAAAAGVANAAVAGFLSGAIASGSLKGAVNGAFSGALFFGVGEFTGAASGLGKVMAHSAAGCISAAAGGGNCKAGAMAAGFAEFAGPAIGDLGSIAANVTKSAVLGGIGSSIGGGRFEDGAMTGAFGYLFNQLAHAGQQALQRGTCTTPSVACSQQNADYRTAYDAQIKSQAIEGFYPEKEAALMLMAPVRGAALIEGLVFRTEHYASRLMAEGLSVSRVERLVGTEVSAMRANMAVNADVGGRLVVDRATIEYRARLLPNGTVNVGTIFPVK